MKPLSAMGDFLLARGGAQGKKFFLESCAPDAI
jgi:hypothetical protein